MRLGCCLLAKTPRSRLFYPANVSADCAYNPKLPNPQCEAQVLREAPRYQCVVDLPWVTHWRALTAADPAAYVVLTRSRSAVDYALSVRHFDDYRYDHMLGSGLNLNQQSWMEGRENVSAIIARYETHLTEVRAAMRGRRRYFEVCFMCGDDLLTVARSLQLDTERMRLDEGSSAVRFNAHKSDPTADVDFVRKYASYLIQGASN